MSWRDVEEGNVGFGWYNPETNEVPYVCWIWEDAGLAMQHLFVIRSQEGPNWSVVPMIADGTKFVMVQDASPELLRKAKALQWPAVYKSNGSDVKTPSAPVEHN